MTMMVVKGQKVDVTKQFPGLTKVIVGLGWHTGSELDLDASAFQLGATGKVNREEDFIFYGNPKSTNGAVSLRDGTGDKQQFELELSAIPLNVEKIAFTITIYDAISRGQTFRQVSDLYLRILHPVTFAEMIRFPLVDFSTENSIVTGELYRYNGEWKFNAIGSGFNGGLTALCGNFGVEVAQEQSSSPQPSPTIPAPPPKVEQPPAPPINLSKVELTKKGETISLRKSSGALGQISVNLNWNRKAKKSGGFLGFNKSDGIDLDLGCLYEMSDGNKGCIQALGRLFGEYLHFPFIELDGDDRTGSRTDGENLRINGNHLREFNRVLIYAYIYEGVAKWAETDGVVTIKQADNPEIVVRMDVHDPRKITCAVAMIERKGDTFEIKRLVEYFNGHIQMDRYYGWNMRWGAAGSK
ncbi:tellurium resistance protein TerA [Brevibacillus brevis]|uniref:TerD family protein n=1 Tax=Brevibacillus brevis TaxID=1393 RepID=UPI000B38DE61|nr:TerD family protein [Brevibacillus brevis]OUQ87015.1 tellurium resistance protein TerA [Brevibacillus brevis]